MPDRARVMIEMPNKNILAAFLAVVTAAAAVARAPHEARPRSLPSPCKFLLLTNDFSGPNQRDKLVRAIDRAAAAGFNIIVTDSGKSADIISCLDRTTTNGISTVQSTPGTGDDPLTVIIHEAHRQRLLVHVRLCLQDELGKQNESIAVSTAGRGEAGPSDLAADSRKLTDGPRLARKNLALAERVLKEHDVDGILLDGLGSSLAAADSTGLSKILFEKHIGKRLERWPDEVCTTSGSLAGEPVCIGPYYGQWVLWRAGVIRDSVSEMHKAAQKHPGCLIGACVHSSIDERRDINWAPRRRETSRVSDWAPPGYEKTSFLDQLDYLSPRLVPVSATGSHSHLTTSSIEKDLDRTLQITGDDVPLAPVLNAAALDTEEQYEAAIRLCLEKTGGIMIISQSEIDSMDRWDATMRGLEATRKFLE